MKRVSKRFAAAVAVAFSAGLFAAGLTLASDSPTVTLSSGSPVSTGWLGSPYSVAFSPNSGLIATADLSASSGAQLGIFSVGAGGALTPGVGAVLGGVGSVEPQTTMFSPNGGLVAVDAFSDSTAAGTVSMFSVTSDGLLTQVFGSPFATGNYPVGMAFSPDGDLLATANYLDQTVSVFSVASDGSLTQVAGSPFPAGGAAYGLAFSPSGNLLATTSLTGNSVSVFSVSANGQLTQVAGSPFAMGAGTDPVQVAFSPAGNLLAVGDEGAGAVSMFSVAAGGALTQVSGSPFVTGATSSNVAFSPDGGVLVTDGPTIGSGPSANSSIVVYSVGSSGALTALTGSPLNAGGQPGPDPVAFSPSGGLIAAAVSGDQYSEVSTFTVSAAAVSAPSSSGTTTTQTTATQTTATTDTTTTAIAAPKPPFGGTAAPPGATLPDKPVKVKPPVAEASTKPAFGSGLLAYKLSSEGSKAAVGKHLISYVWRLDGRVISHEANPVYRFSRPNKTYALALTVKQTGGETGNATASVDPREAKQTTKTKNKTKNKRKTKTKTTTIVTTSTTTLTLSSDTLFAWNSFVLTAAAKRELTAARASILRSPAVKISGYCDNTGDNDPVSEGNTYNVWLSKMRALAVADFLYKDRLPKTVKLTGYGRTQFIATNATAVGRAENRRVTISYETVTRTTS